VVSGQDVSGAEYEYAFVIRESNVGRVVAALDGSAGADLLELLKSIAEPSWLRANRHG
jgi:hypothetical protein